MTGLRDQETLAAAELAHEIRNLLTIITSSAQMLRRMLPHGSDGQALIDDILEASSHADVAAVRLMDAARAPTKA